MATTIKAITEDNTNSEDHRYEKEVGFQLGMLQVPRMTTELWK